MPADSETNGLWLNAAGVAALLVCGVIGFVFVTSPDSRPILGLGLVIVVALLVAIALSPRLDRLRIGLNKFEADFRQLDNKVREQQEKLGEQKGQLGEQQEQIGKQKEQIGKQKDQIEEQAKQLARQQEVINNLVKFSMSDSIFRHLCGLACLDRYIYYDNPPFAREMYFLRDNGLIQPKDAAHHHFLDFGAAQDNSDLTQYIEPTPIGWDCIKLRRQYAHEVVQKHVNRGPGQMKIDPVNLQDV